MKRRSLTGGIKARSGKLWSPTQEGLAVVSPQARFGDRPATDESVGKEGMRSHVESEH
jgi:hypothetical protein